jgi:hypothetical protein
MSRNCLANHDWCNGPDGIKNKSVTFGGLCGTCWERQTMETANKR